MYDFKDIRDLNNLRGASALVEVAAMARIGALSAGADLTSKRALQLERDAKRLDRRGKTERARTLKTKAADLRSVMRSIHVQREKEQIRPLVPVDDGAVLQGRASKEGVGKKGLTVSLVDAEGKVLDSAKTAANGAFLLKQGARDKGVLVVVADVDGKELGTLEPPALGSKASVFLDLPVERLGLKGTRRDPKSKEGRKPGKDSARSVVVPKLMAMPLEKAVVRLRADLTLGKVTLERAPRRASEVLKQSPEADSKVEVGTAVDLWVGVGDARRDFATARVLIRQHPDIVRAKISPRRLTQAEKKAKIQTLADLRKLPDMDPSEVAALMPGGREAQAKAWQSAAKSVLAQFPGK